MKIISHRGNINGPVPEKENSPSYIDAAIGLGYDVEVDLRFINGEFWLGHDLPQYKINKSWMDLRKENIWYHCKDIDSSLELIKLNEGFKYFCHSQDDYVITSVGKLWVHDLSKTINKDCIIPLLNLSDITNYKNTEPYSVCTDYVFECRDNLKFL
jgi:hypothetical protein